MTAASVNRNCSICGAAMAVVHQATVLGKYRVSYFYCESCGFLRTERPYWLEEAYSSAIAASDTGLLRRNLHMSQTLASVLFLAFRDKRKGQWLDYAGGYGMLARLMRDKGFDFYWSDKHADNIFASGFGHNDGMTYDGVTAIEVLEHTVNPMAFLAELLRLSRTRTVIVTTEVCPSPPPRPEDWWYYGLNTGQHISFFQERTLKTMAHRLEVKYLRAGGLHIFSEKLPNIFLSRLASCRVSILGDFIARRCLHSKVVTDHQFVATSRNVQLP